MAVRGSVLVVGGGSAGTAAARILADADFRVTVAEPGKLGGLCLWRGCVPKKALYRSADVLRLTRSAEQFGVLPGEPALDWQGVLAWKWHAQETYAGDQEALLAARGIERVDAPARFLSPETLEVGGSVLAPDHVVVAAGSEPVVLGIPGAELADVSDDVLHYPEPPESLLVVGGGYVGMEFASAYALFGTEVSVVTDGVRVLEHADAEAAGVVTKRMAATGARFVTGARVSAIEGEPGALRTYYETPREKSSIGSQRVLMAAGRRPALSELDLATGGVETDERGRPVLDEALRSVSNPRVFFAGDARGDLMLTPLASYDGRLAARSIVGGGPLPHDAVVPQVTFTHPPIGQVGLTEEAAAARGLAVRVGRQPFEPLGAAIIDDERTGFVKLLFAADDGRLVGAHVAGVAAPELVWALALAVRVRATAEDMRATLGVHPAFCEALNWAAWA